MSRKKLISVVLRYPLHGVCYSNPKKLIQLGPAVARGELCPGGSGHRAPGGVVLTSEEQPGSSGKLLMPRPTQVNDITILGEWAWLFFFFPMQGQVQEPLSKETLPEA